MITAEFLRTLDNDELHSRTVRVARSERKIMHLVLLHIREVERRMLYVAYECDSIKQYCIKHLKYSESSANRRMQAARLLDLLPEISDSVQSGALNLTTLTVAQSVMRAEEKRAGEKIHIEDKREIITYLENKTTDQVMRTLAQVFPDVQPPVEKTRPLADDKTQVSFVMPKSLSQKLERVRELESHKHGHLGWAELFEILADFYLDRRAPERKTVRVRKTSAKKNQTTLQKTASKSDTSVASSFDQTHEAPSSVETSITNTDSQPQVESTINPTNEPASQCATAPDPAIQNKNDLHSQATSDNDFSPARPSQVPANTLPKRKKHSVSTQRHLHLRSGSQCEHVDPMTGLRCTRRFHLQIDHRIPLSRGGSDELGNLQLLCATHNLFKGMSTSAPRHAH